MSYYLYFVRFAHTEHKSKFPLIVVQKIVHSFHGQLFSWAYIKLFKCPLVAEIHVILSRTRFRVHTLSIPDWHLLQPRYMYQ